MENSTGDLAHPRQEIPMKRYVLLLSAAMLGVLLSSDGAFAQSGDELSAPPQPPRRPTTTSPSNPSNDYGPAPKPNPSNEYGAAPNPIRPANTARLLRLIRACRRDPIRGRCPHERPPSKRG